MKRFFVIFLITTSFLFSASSVHALVALPPQLRDTQQTMLGENHAYSVTFRGNGEAVVLLRAQFTNTTTTPVTDVALRIPAIRTSDILAFQAKAAPSCIGYAPAVGNIPPPCIAYDEAQGYEYPYQNLTFTKATTTLEGDTLRITLPLPVVPDASGSYLLSFRAFGYARKNILGAWAYQFETFKINQPILQALIGISVDPDMVLSGVKGKTNYRFTEDVAMLAAPAARMQTEADARLRDFYYTIGQGDIVKTSTNLAALESYTVKGKFADSSLKLYGREIAIALFVFLLFLVLCVFGIRKLGRIYRQSDVKRLPSNNRPNSHRILILFIVSFVSASLVLAYTFLLIFFFRSLFPTISYDVQPFLGLLTVVLSIGIYGTLLVGPSIAAGFKFGGMAALGNFGLTMVFLLIEGFVTLFITAIIQPRFSVTPMPYQGVLEKSVSAPAQDASGVSQP